MSDEAIEALRRRFRRVAIVHEWLTIPGGSEQVVLELLALFPEAEIFTTVYDVDRWQGALGAQTVHASWLDRAPRARSSYRLLLPLMHGAIRSFDLSGFDLVISSNHAFAKNARTAAGTLHVCYCHTPMRYAWEPGFLEGERIGRIGRTLIGPILATLRRWDLDGAKNPDLLVANSEHVAARIERFYGRHALVVNPPVDVDHFLELERKPEDFYLVFGRVVPYKRVDLAVQACLRSGRRLKIAGDGRALKSIRRICRGHRNIEVIGHVDERQRDELFARARALIFPGEEDFGIVPVEAQAAGMPVVAFNCGGASESVLDEVTGILFPRQDQDCLQEALDRFEASTFNEQAIRERAKAFGRKRFRTQMAKVIEDAAEARLSARQPAP
ncbi:MAG TPA: glycosyltransferase [Solirubrobacteraceae bacterium]|nr:glycosyltransferase [Solirubrobacteraceae bacterium]